MDGLLEPDDEACLKIVLKVPPAEIAEGAT